MNAPRIIVVGGGAAGFFAAIAAAEAAPEAGVTILEKSAQFLGKVRISGGGRCNVTHRWHEPREFAARYPRGGSALIGPLQRFGAADTAAWFEGRGVALKTEADGRLFPVTDSSETIMGCLMQAARRAGVELRTHSAVAAVRRGGGGGFELTLAGGEPVAGDRLLLATGGCRAAAAGALAVSLGHTLEPPVPSLFTFHVETPWLRGLAGVTVPEAEVSVPALRLGERGPLLVTHWGFSGPAVLRLSAWGARALHGAGYRFTLRVNWRAGLSLEALDAELVARIEHHH
ncbi:MAG TPA: aminoacetone oxidase family FAD-binding enzyme, partial [Verrucomicrobiota bacterium]|nr:aminoacetone oxidase family FAD-binding enzyme [Verrucomicrobiota bacterium]